MGLGWLAADVLMSEGALVDTFRAAPSKCSTRRNGRQWPPCYARWIVDRYRTAFQAVVAVYPDVCEVTERAFPTEQGQTCRNLVRCWRGDLKRDSLAAA